MTSPLIPQTVCKLYLLKLIFSCVINLLLTLLSGETLYWPSSLCCRDLWQIHVLISHYIPHTWLMKCISVYNYLFLLKCFLSHRFTSAENQNVTKTVIEAVVGDYCGVHRCPWSTAELKSRCQELHTCMWQIAGKKSTHRYLMKLSLDS